MDTTVGKVESQFRLTDVIVPLSATLTAVAFLSQSMTVSPMMLNVLYYAAFGIIIMAGLAILDLIISYFLVPRVRR